MSPRLALQFLGPPQINLEDSLITTDRRKAVALLAYLAINRGKHTREFLSGFFWPDYEQANAFSNLRRTIWEVHQALGENWLIADRETVSLNGVGKIDLDVTQFQELLSQASHQSDIPLRIPLLADAIKLYRNHFLTGFSLKDSYPFNEWAYAETEELRHQLAEALTTLSADYCALGQAEKAIPHVRRLISLDPLNESSHRQLMQVYLQAGQHSAALKQYQACEQILRKELNLDPQPETYALYKDIRKREKKNIQIEKSIELSTPTHNLPLQISSFVGREKEQDEITNLIYKHRLVTLAGVGGIGKTRLSLQVGQRVLKNFSDGAWFIALDSLSDPVLVPQTVASVLDIREVTDRSVIETLIYVLRQKTTLLIFDNCEHLLDSCTQLITSLLTNCPNLKILVTSREVLNVGGEAIFNLPALCLPEEDNDSLEQLNGYESIQLFTERAELALSSFRLTDKNIQSVVDVCRIVDGIPLAIELAAARINILQVDEILKQLQHSFALLSSDGRSIIQRQQTIQASMDWSWGLLSQAEQVFLRQLSVFAGGWTLESAQAICDGDVLGLTSALVQKSLILVKQESSRQTRYHFHEIVRQYAHERLAQAGEEKNVRTQHLRYFLQFFEQTEAGLRGPEQIEWYARLSEERDNIRAALEWADQTDVEAGLYLSSRLQRPEESMDFREDNYWLSRFLQKVESHAYPRARAKALLAYRWILHSLEKFDEFRSAAQECLALYRALGDEYGEVEALLWMAQEASDPLEAFTLLQQALTLAHSLGDARTQAEALGQLGWLDSGNKLVHWKKAIALRRQVGDLLKLAQSLSTMGFFLILNGDIVAAREHLAEASALYEQLNLKSARTGFLMAYGKMALVEGDFEKARASFQGEVKISVEFGHRLDYLWARVHLGYVVLREGSIAEAREIFGETVQDFQKDKNIIGVVFTLEGMAGLYVTTNKLAWAARLIGWADAVRKEINDIRPLLEQGDVDKIIAACLAKMGEVAFSDAYDEGQKMTMDEAVAYALEELKG